MPEGRIKYSRPAIYSPKVVSGNPNFKNHLRAGLEGSAVLITVPGNLNETLPISAS